MTRDLMKREWQVVGPGGMKCPCCGPRHGKKGERKSARRRLRLATKLEVRATLAELRRSEGSET